MCKLKPRIVSHYIFHDLLLSLFSLCQSNFYIQTRSEKAYPLGQIAHLLHAFCPNGLILYVMLWLVEQIKKHSVIIVMSLVGNLIRYQINSPAAIQNFKHFLQDDTLDFALGAGK